VQKILVKRWGGVVEEASNSDGVSRAKIITPRPYPGACHSGDGIGQGANKGKLK